MLNVLAIAIVRSTLPDAGMAQDIFVPPVTTTDPGYLFPNDRYQRDRDSARICEPAGWSRRLPRDNWVSQQIDRNLIDDFLADHADLADVQTIARLGLLPDQLMWLPLNFIPAQWQPTGSIS